MHWLKIFGLKIEAKRLEEKQLWRKRSGVKQLLIVINPSTCIMVLKPLHGASLELIVVK